MYVPHRQPKGVSHWFAVALVGGFSLGLLVFFFAIRRRPAAEPTSPALRDARSDEGWFENYQPTPVASTPVPYAPPEVAPVVVSSIPPVAPQPQQRPYAQPTMT